MDRLALLGTRVGFSVLAVWAGLASVGDMAVRAEGGSRHAEAVVVAQAPTIARKKSEDVCLSQSDVRALVKQRTVLAPAQILRKARASGGAGAKVVRALLCRRDNNQLIYRISLLLRDGRVTSVVVNARTGRIEVFK